MNEAGKKTASTTNKDEAVVGKEKQKEGLGPEQQQQGERDDDEDPVAVLARLHQVTDLLRMPCPYHETDTTPS